MSRDSSGTYTRVVGPYTAGTLAKSSEINSEMNDLGAEVTASLEKSGKTTWTGNQPANGYGVKNLANTKLFTTAGGTTAYTVTTGAGFTAYSQLPIIWVKWNVTNTGASTLNVDGIAVVNIKRSDGTAVANGDLVINTVSALVYDGSNLLLEGNPSLQARDATLDALAALSWSSGKPVIQFTAADTVSLTTALSMGDGSAGTPSYGFASTSGMGLYTVSSELALATGGVARLYTNTSRIQAKLPMYFDDGSVSAPIIANTTENNSGRYRIGTKNFGEAINGVKVFDWSDTRLLMASAYDLQRATDVTTPTAASVGYIGTIIVAKDATYTVAANIAGQTLYHTSASTHTYTIDSNANLALPIGFMFKVVNESGGGNVTVAITADTLRWNASTGSRTIAANGSAVFTKVAATVWRCEAGYGVS